MPPREVAGKSQLEHGLVIARVGQGHVDGRQVGAGRAVTAPRRGRRHFKDHVGGIVAVDGRGVVAEHLHGVRRLRRCRPLLRNVVIRVGADVESERHGIDGRGARGEGLGAPVRLALDGHLEGHHAVVAHCAAVVGALLLPALLGERRSERRVRIDQFQGADIGVTLRSAP